MQDGLTGSAWGDWANYTASPLRAFENELGVQAPVGFWDPVGFTSDGDVAAFKRRRSVELKHGRISMMATMGASDFIVYFFVCFLIATTAAHQSIWNLTLSCVSLTIDEMQCAFRSFVARIYYPRDHWQAAPDSAIEI